MVIEQFQVYWVNLDPTIGAEIKKIRPCVVVSPNELNLYLDTVIVIPITSKIHSYPYRVRCNIHNREGEIATDQIRTIDKHRIRNFICTLASSEKANLKEVLYQMFS